MSLIYTTRFYDAALPGGLITAYTVPANKLAVVNFVGAYSITSTAWTLLIGGPGLLGFGGLNMTSFVGESKQLIGCRFVYAAGESILLNSPASSGNGYVSGFLFDV